MLHKRLSVLGLILFLSLGLFYYVTYVHTTASVDAESVTPDVTVVQTQTPVVSVPLTPIDHTLYDKALAHITNGDTSGKWPASIVYPSAGALLPFNRIVAFYGNFYSKKMGALGEYAPEEVNRRLQLEVKKWEVLDPQTPVIPAFHYIATVAQGYAGKDHLYISRMPTTEIDKVIAMADKYHAIVFLDVQVSQSTVEKEIPLLEKYLKMPNVHLGIDPEFSMKNGKKPGTVIGTLGAADINFVTGYLAKLVKDNHLPAKILVVHRFTGPMVTGYKSITRPPEVQIVMDMDGWGTPEHKLATYTQVIHSQPVEFTGFKLFYKNDIKQPKSRMLTPAEILKLTPQPSYIQYQ